MPLIYYYHRGLLKKNKIIDLLKQIAITNSIINNYNGIRNKVDCILQKHDYTISDNVACLLCRFFSQEKATFIMYSLFDKNIEDIVFIVADYYKQPPSIFRNETINDILRIYSDIIINNKINNDILEG